VSALDRIAELHTARDADGNCRVCGIYVAWPCPTRRLCDEAGPENGVWQCLGQALTDRDAARADADRLAAAIVAYWSVDGHRNDEGGSRTTWDAAAFIEAKKLVAAALAAHDAARTKKGL